MIRIHFRVKRAAVPYTATCRVCGKRRRRTMVVEHTVNPWNRNSDGIPRTPEEVQACAAQTAKERARECEEQGIVCRTCENAEDAS